MKKKVKLIPVYLLVFSLFAPCTTQAAANITHSTYTAAPQKSLSHPDAVIKSSGDIKQ